MRKFGIEIEFFSAETGHEIARLLNDAGVVTAFEGYNHVTRDHWKIVTDGSLNPAPAQRGMRGLELVSPVLEGEEAFETIRKASAVLLRAGCKINRTCGLHVHIDARGERLEFFRSLVSLYRNFEPVIDEVQPASRRGASNSYCQPLTMVSEAAIRDAATIEQLAARLVRGRYHKLNLQSFWRHGTVEFRHHAGTVEASKIIAWVKACQAMVAQAAGATVAPARSHSARPGSKVAQMADMLIARGAVTHEELETAIGGNLFNVAHNMRRHGLEVRTERRRGRQTRYVLIGAAEVAPAAPVAFTFEAWASMVGEAAYWEARRASLTGGAA